MAMVCYVAAQFWEPKGCGFYELRMGLWALGCPSQSEEGSRAQVHLTHPATMLFAGGAHSSWCACVCAARHSGHSAQLSVLCAILRCVFRVGGRAMGGGMCGEVVE